MPIINNLIDQLYTIFVLLGDTGRCPWAKLHTPAGQFQFTVMPFGLLGTPSLFQQMMDSLTKDTNDFTAAYLDDLIIFNDTWEHHLLSLLPISQ